MDEYQWELVSEDSYQEVGGPRLRVCIRRYRGVDGVEDLTVDLPLPEAIEQGWRGRVAAVRERNPDMPLQMAQQIAQDRYASELAKKHGGG